MIGKLKHTMLTEDAVFFSWLVAQLVCGSYSSWKIFPALQIFSSELETNPLFIYFSDCKELRNIREINVVI